MDEFCSSVHHCDLESLQWWEVFVGDVDCLWDKWVVVLGFDEVLVAADGDGEMLVVVVGGGGDGECGGEEGGLVWWGPCKVPWFGPHIDDGG